MRTDRDSVALVTTARHLTADGVSRSQLAAELAAHRWQRAGLAIVLHNGPLSRQQTWEVARVHGGPQSMLAAFTAAEFGGLKGWERSETHLLAPSGTRARAGCPVAMRLHVYRGGHPVRAPKRRVESLAHAVLRASGTFPNARPACGILAAAVQQRRVTVNSLQTALDSFPRLRNHAAVGSAIADIAGGSEALSEIDFVRLCRRSGLPEPERQQVRREPSGRRRYLDASWRRSDGRLVVAEVDGALHLIAKTWWNDQLRQNELAIGDALVLRFPTVIVRAEPHLVVDQLSRALWLPAKGMQTRRR